MSEWDTVTVLRKKVHPVANTEQAVNKARRQGAEVETFTKTSATNKHTVPPQNASKLDRDTETLKHSKIPLDMAKLISQMRLSKGLSQKDLATKICEKVQVINDYEAGRAIPSNAIMTKIERALGVKLRGKDRGQPLPTKQDKSNKK